MNTKKNIKIVNPNKFGLSGRTMIGTDNKKNYYIIKNIKLSIARVFVGHDYRSYSE